jgi:hypothetical protein
MVDTQFNEDHFRDDGTSCRLGEQCPFSSVHSRLQEAHRHWHSADTNYAEPAAFRTYLNSCIQALRNVTFVLQKHKSLLLDFEKWYSPWQISLSKDPVLRWIITARNTIVKMGDLETLSVARVSILDDYSSPEVIDFIVPSSHSSLEITESLIPRFNIPVDVIKDGIFRLERRWVASNLPDMELLDALAHAYTVLAYLVEDAHKPVNTPRPVVGHVDILRGQRLACMTNTDGPRSFLIRLLDGQHLTVRKTEMPTRQLSITEAREHYGIVPIAPELLKRNPRDLRANSEFFFSIARTVMEKDGYHRSIAFLLLPNGRSQIGNFDLKDRVDKLLIWRKIASEVERLRAYAVIFISEVWTAEFDASNPTLTASDSPKREEALALDALDSTGVHVSFLARIYRTSNEVILGETQDMSDMRPLYLNPVCETWKRMHARAEAAPPRDRNEDNQNSAGSPNS